MKPAHPESALRQLRTIIGSLPARRLFSPILSPRLGAVALSLGVLAGCSPDDSPVGHRSSGAEGNNAQRDAGADVADSSAPDVAVDSAPADASPSGPDVEIPRRDAGTFPYPPCPSDFGFDQPSTPWTVTEGDSPSNTLELALHLPSGSAPEDWTVSADASMPGWVLLPGAPSTVSTLTLSINGTVPYNAYPGPPLFTVHLAPVARPECELSTVVNLTVNNRLYVDPVSDSLPDAITAVAFQPALNRYVLLQPSTNSVYLLDLSLGIAALSNPIVLPGTGTLGSMFAANDQHIYVVRDDNLYRLDANGQLNPSDGPIPLAPRSSCPDMPRRLTATNGWVLTAGLDDPAQLIADGTSAVVTQPYVHQTYSVDSDTDALALLGWVDPGSVGISSSLASALPALDSNPACPSDDSSILSVSQGHVAVVRLSEIDPSFGYFAIGAPCGSKTSFPLSFADGWRVQRSVMYAGQALFLLFHTNSNTVVTGWKLALLDAQTGAEIGLQTPLSNVIPAELLWKTRGWAIATTFKNAADDPSHPVLIQM